MASAVIIGRLIHRPYWQHGVFFSGAASWTAFLLFLTLTQPQKRWVTSHQELLATKGTGEQLTFECFPDDLHIHSTTVRFTFFSCLTASAWCVLGSDQQCFVECHQTPADGDFRDHLNWFGKESKTKSLETNWSEVLSVLHQFHRLLFQKWARWDVYFFS